MNETLFNLAAEQTTTDDYYTPKWVFEALDVEFDIDVAAPAHGIPWLPAKRWFSQADDGLSQDWGGQFVWMNPPFSKATPWAHKFIANGNGIALMPVSRSKWLIDIWRLPAISVMLTPTDLKFETPEGLQKTISYQTFLFAIGEKGVNSLKQCGLGHVR